MQTVHVICCVLELLQTEGVKGNKNPTHAIHVSVNLKLVHVPTWMVQKEMSMSKQQTLISEYAKKGFSRILTIFIRLVHFVYSILCVCVIVCTNTLLLCVRFMIYWSRKYILKKKILPFLLYCMLAY